MQELVDAHFDISTGVLRPPAGDPKTVARQMHDAQRRVLMRRSAAFVADVEEEVLPFFANGDEVFPEKIDVDVVPVTTEHDAAIFRYCSLMWSVPVSQGYGRRSRFVIWDRSNQRVIGIFALGDPVFNLAARDDEIGWTQDHRRHRLYNCFDAFVLGAVAPYRQLIGGKLAALCTLSVEVLQFLEEKYRGQQTVIRGEVKNSAPVLITTTSALGRSSIYNRLAIEGEPAFFPVGYTRGYGHFHFSDELFIDLRELADRTGRARGSQYGQGPNFRIRVIRSALDELGLPGELLKHGIERQVFLAPVSVNWKAFLRCESDLVRPINRPLCDLAAFWRERWAVPRGSRRQEFRQWTREQMRLSNESVC